MSTLAIIPARFESTRLPGKILANIAGKPMIQRVYEGVLKAQVVDELVVATDSHKIANAVTQFGGKVIRTSANHISGTSRCCEAWNALKTSKFDYIINVQGDEPFIHHEHLTLLSTAIASSEADLATLAIRRKNKEEFFNRNVVKTVIDRSNKALYFSRSPIPYQEENYAFFQHIGMYAYTAEFLASFQSMPTSELAQQESLEQLQWLEAGYKIQVAITDKESIGVDTAEDLAKAKEFALKNQ